jgi:hypothetical protein
LQISSHDLILESKIQRPFFCKKGEKYEVFLLGEERLALGEERLALGEERLALGEERLLALGEERLLALGNDLLCSMKEELFSLEKLLPVLGEEMSTLEPMVLGEEMSTLEPMVLEAPMVLEEELPMLQNHFHSDSYSIFLFDQSPNN